MRRTILVFSLLAFFISFSFSQSRELTGQILDIHTDEPIPYSTVEIKNKQMGAASDPDGVFYLKLSPEITIDDTLIAKSLGYFDSIFTIAEYQKTRGEIIQLRPKTFQLETLVVKPTPDVLRKGVFGKPIAPAYGLAGNQLAVFMSNEEKVEGVIRSANFCIGDSPKPKTPFRVRIYGVNESGAPGKDLINEEIIIKGKKKRKWVEVDLSRYQIPVPSDGYFVAMEWIFSGEKFHYKIKNPPKNRTGILYGQALARTFGQDEPLTWAYTLGGEWWLFDYKFTIKGERMYGNSLINSTIQIYK